MAPNLEKLQGLRILVAEDELLVLLVLENMLREIGCEVVGPVATVDAALDAISRGGIDGALLDMNLHGRRITPAVEELVARGVPFLLCTGYGRSPREEPVIRDAPRLTKPFNLENLRTAVGAIFIDAARCGSLPQKIVR